LDLDTKYNLDGNLGEPEFKMERAAKVPVDILPWAMQACQSSLQEELNNVGIFHTLLSEKRDTGSGAKRPCHTGSSSGLSNDER
jgi:hypothetical protein